MKRLLVITAYAMIAMAVVIITILLVAYGQGYTYDFSSKRFVLKGMVMLESIPGGAKIEINSKSIDKKTPVRLTLESGKYLFKVYKDGYQKWEKALKINVSQVSFAQYIWLFPKDIKSNMITSQKQNVIKYVPSPSQNEIAYINIGNDPGLWIINTQNRQAIKLYTSTKNDELTDIIWSKDSSKLLLKIKNLDNVNWWYLSAKDSNNKVNLTNIYKFNFDELRFNPSDINQLYWISPEGLRLIDLNSKTISSVIVDNIIAYTLDADHVFYIQKTIIGNKLWSIDKNGNKQEIISSLPESSIYKILYEKYNNKDYLAVVVGDIHTLTLYTDIFQTHITSKVLSKNTDNIIFNTKHRFLAFYTANSIGSYNLETEHIYNFKINISKLDYISWLDNQHLLLNSNDQVYAIEYDGNNLTHLTSCKIGFPSYVTNNKNDIVIIKSNQSGNGISLASLKL